MTSETRLKLAKHYASLDEAKKARQKNLAKYYEEFKNKLTKKTEKNTSKKTKKGDE